MSWRAEKDVALTSPLYPTTEENKQILESQKNMWISSRIMPLQVESILSESLKSMGIHL